MSYRSDVCFFRSGCVGRTSLALWSLTVLLNIFLPAGCAPRSTLQPISEDSGEIVPTPAVVTAPGPTPSEAEWNWEDLGQLISTREYWDISFLAGTKVGYEHTVIEERQRGGRPLVRIIQRQVMTLRRFSQTAEMTLEVESWQTPQGQLLAFRGKQLQGVAAQEFSGVVRGDVVEIEQTTLGRRERQQIAWDQSVGGFRAVEDSLGREPLEPGRRWSVRYLLPVFNTVVQTDLEVKQPEPVRLLSGTYELIRVDMRTHAPIGLELRGSLWVDRSGEVLKSFTDLMSLEVYRGTREDALAEPGEFTFDLGVDIRVPVTGKIDRPHETTCVRYRVVWEGGDPARLFAVGASQVVQPVNASTVDVTVYALRPDWPAPGSQSPPEDPPGEAELSPSSFIQSDYPTIVALADECTQGLGSPWEIAVTLEKTVHDWIRDSNYKVGFATAAEVVESRQGDCTEHAVLLAALARAKKIPARVAMGLVYNQGAFYYHMWTEVWIAGQWYPLDATLGRGGIGAAHLKMATSNLEGPAALARMLPLLEAIGKLKVEVLEVSHTVPASSPRD